MSAMGFLSYHRDFLLVVFGAVVDLSAVGFVLLELDL